MPRIRTLKPEIATDAALARVSRDARYTFVLLITQSDDYGLVAGNPRQLIGTLYPNDEDVDIPTLMGWIGELVEQEFIRWRETKDGQKVLELINWKRHQKVDHPTKSPLAEQLLPNDSRSPRETLASDSRPDLGPRTKDHVPRTKDLGPQDPVGKTDGGGSSGTVTKPKSRRKPPGTYSPEFERFYKAYPKPVGKSEAWDEWPAAVAYIEQQRKCNPAEAAEWLIQTTVSYASSPQGQRKQFCKDPCRWLKHKRFEDDPSVWQQTDDRPPQRSRRDEIPAGPGSRLFQNGAPVPDDAY